MKGFAHAFSDKETHKLFFQLAFVILAIGIFWYGSTLPAPTISSEVGVAETSPVGEAGGFSVPASCASSYDHAPTPAPASCSCAANYNTVCSVTSSPNACGQTVVRNGLRQCNGTCATNLNSVILYENAGYTGWSWGYTRTTDAGAQPLMTGASSIRLNGASRAVVCSSYAYDINNIYGSTYDTDCIAFTSDDSTPVGGPYFPSGQDYNDKIFLVKNPVYPTVSTAPPSNSGCSVTVTTDIKANGSDGPITIYDNNRQVAISWTSVNASSCTVSNNVTSTAWNGMSGSQSAYIGTYNGGSQIFTSSCTGTGGSGTDSVTVNLCSWRTGQPCYSSNSCGMLSSEMGTIGCGGYCSATPPSESLCPPTTTTGGTDTTGGTGGTSGGGTGDTLSSAVCGNGICETGESAATCPSDCGIPIIGSGELPVFIDLNTDALGGYFSAAPNPIIKSRSTLLSWNIEGTRPITCTLEGRKARDNSFVERITGLGPIGSHWSARLVEDTNYTLTCSNSFSSDSQTILVRVLSTSFIEF